MTKILFLALMTMVAASCGDSSKGKPKSGTSVAGVVGGRSLKLGDVVFGNASASGLEFQGESTTLFFTTFANACTHLTAGDAVASSGNLFVGLADVAADGTAVPITSPGDYAIFSGSPPASSRSAQALVEYLDSACLKTALVEATAGSITVANLGGGSIEGLLQLTFASGETISGSFAAVECLAFDPNSSVFSTCN